MLPPSPSPTPLCGLFTTIQHADASPGYLISVSSTVIEAASTWSLAVVIASADHTACFSSRLSTPTDPDAVAGIVAAFRARAVSVAIPPHYNDWPLDGWSSVRIYLDGTGAPMRLKARRVQGQQAVDMAGMAMFKMYQHRQPQLYLALAERSESEDDLRLVLAQTRATLRNEREKYRRMLSSSSSASSRLPSSQSRLSSSQSRLSSSQRGSSSSDRNQSSPSTSWQGSSPPRKRARSTESEERDESPTPVKTRWMGSLVNPARVYRANPSDNDKFVDPDETL
ncbi:hypothetical protein ACQY0O_005116 [Thecaphora frezii]